jgi:hypothetical protein
VVGDNPLRPAKVSVRDQGFAVVDLNAAGVYQSNYAATFEEATQRMRNALRIRPDLEGQLEVLPSHEIV